jgi:hypothetical protein
MLCVGASVETDESEASTRSGLASAISRTPLRLSERFSKLIWDAMSGLKELGHGRFKHEPV